MKRTRLFLGGIILLFTTTTARGQFSVGGTIGLQAPLGSFGGSFQPGFGINATGRYAINDNFKVGLNLGYSGFTAKFGAGAHAHMVPVTGLLEYHFGTGAFRPYIGADLGIYRLGLTVDYGYTYGSAAYSHTYIGFAPSAGASYALNETVALTGNLKFNHFQGTSWLGVNAGAIFTLN